MTSTPAGWYPDPQRRAVARWHDGQQWTTHTTNAQTPPPPPRPPWGWKQYTILAGVLVAALGVYIGYSAITGPSAEERAAAERAKTDQQAAEQAVFDARSAELQAKSAAEITCEKLVTNRLKAPATADFTGVTTYKDGAGDYITKGAVDSENTFGANIRTTFLCITHNGTTTLDRIN
ncbi:DUF2510 domain-containing protein [Rhodococcus sp. ZPP]|uniref:DUF2510 domain-containing protein n=1 Tax=Rhodococcus sp. ZPP TaxID=2749906 RepID=UPI001AD8713A|nr:DUF2510 domain-containing protein [Rhodococcus sp. ZPP]QTJ65866.1 DUF2510 domain-containing protein [Rhodococcus sp. ZPP]